jgi:hypothetical protein
MTLAGQLFRGAYSYVSITDAVCAVIVFSLERSAFVLLPCATSYVCSGIEL